MLHNKKRLPLAVLESSRLYVGSLPMYPVVGGFSALVVVAASAQANRRRVKKISRAPADSLSGEAEQMLQTFPLDGDRYILPLSDPIKIFSNLRKLSRLVVPFEIPGPDSGGWVFAIKSLWSENQSMVTLLLAKSLCEQLVARIVPTMQTSNTVGLISLYGQQLDLVENLMEIGEERPWKPVLPRLEVS